MNGSILLWGFGGGKMLMIYIWRYSFIHGSRGDFFSLSSQNKELTEV
jgi:hypothetical protein